MAILKMVVPLEAVLAVAVLTGCTIKRVLPPKRPPTKMVVTQAVKDVTVTLVPRSYAAWTFIVNNRRDEHLRLIWDESSFIATNQFSQGRLIRGGTRVIDSGRVQPASPIAARSRMSEVAIPERLASFQPREIEVSLSGTSKGPSPKANSSEVCAARRKLCTDDAYACARAHRACRTRTDPPSETATTTADGDAPRAVTVGVGRMVLMFDGPRGHEVWTAAISFDGSRLPEVPQPGVETPTTTAPPSPPAPDSQ